VPGCGSKEYLFRGRKRVAGEPGKPQAVETKYRCKGCGHEWKVRVPEEELAGRWRTTVDGYRFLALRGRLRVHRLLREVVRRGGARMGSHFVYVYSVDDARIRAALGSGDRKALNAWLRAIRKQAGGVPESDVEAREEAAEQLIAGGVAPGERHDGHRFGYAFQALCEAWADRRAVVDCYVAKPFPALWALAARAAPNPFGVPQSPHGSGHVGWHEPSAVPALRRALAETPVADPALERFGGTPGNVAELDAVLAHAEAAGRGVVVSWSR
jgi:hypothetical protein